MCPQFNTLENGYMVYTDANFVGSVVEFFCLPEFFLVGADRSNCVNGDPQPKWASAQPTCSSTESKPSNGTPIWVFIVAGVVGMLALIVIAGGIIFGIIYRNRLSQMFKRRPAMRENSYKMSDSIAKQ